MKFLSCKKTARSDPFHSEAPAPAPAPESDPFDLKDLKNDSINAWSECKGGWVRLPLMPNILLSPSWIKIWNRIWTYIRKFKRKKKCHNIINQTLKAGTS